MIPIEAQVLSFASYLALWSAICLAIWALFDRVEATASAAMRASFVSWISREPNVASVRQLPTLFVATFDRFFGDRAFSWGYFLRSALCTAIALGVLLLAWATFRPNEAVWSSPAIPDTLRRCQYVTGGGKWHVGRTRQSSSEKRFV